MKLHAGRAAWWRLQRRAAPSPSPKTTRIAPRPASRPSSKSSWRLFPWFKPGRDTSIVLQEANLREVAVETEKRHGRQSLEYAEALETLAEFLRGNDSLRDAETVYPTVIRIREKSLGERDASLGRAVHGLAAVYQSQARYELADPLYERAVAIRRKALGRDHVQVAESLNGLAGVQLALQRARDGMSSCKEALEIRERAYGDDGHPAVQQSLQNLVLILKAQHLHAQAQAYSVRLV